MDYSGLRETLRVADGTLRVETGALGPSVTKLLTEHNRGAPILVTDAQPGPADGLNETVVVRGRAAFFQAPDVPVELHAAVDRTGNPQIAVRYDVLGDRDAPTRWLFSHSFPTLPTGADWTRTYAEPSRPALDGLRFFASSFFLVSDPSSAPVIDVPRAAGLTFRGLMMPAGVDVLERLLPSSVALDVHGFVVPEKTDVVPLPDGTEPWAVPEPPPGIHLTADVTGTGPAVGELSLGKLTFRLYTPLTDDWRGRNPSHGPRFGYGTTLSMPSAELSVDVFAELEPGAGEVILAGRFSGVTLRALADLVDVAGTSDLLQELPDRVRDGVDTLGGLELTSAAVALRLPETGAGVGIGWAALTVGLPELNWHVWDDHFTITQAACRFVIADPLGTGTRRRPGPDGTPAADTTNKFGVTVAGSMAIEGVPVEVVASNDDGFTVAARLGEAQTIPLRDLVTTHLPGAPPLPDLTIDALSASVAPGRSYGMAMRMVGEPNPWTLPIGPVTLTVSDVALAFTKPRGGPASGAITGTIALGSGSMTMACAVPGELTLKADLPRIALTELAREIAAVADLTLPPGFPDLALEHSTVLLTKNGATYDVRLRTTVAIGDAVDLELAAVVLRSAETTGFAAGIWTGAWANSSGWSPGDVWEPLRALTIEKVGLFLSSVAPTTTQLTNLVPTGAVPAALQSRFQLKAGVNLLASLRIDTGSVEVLRNIFSDTVRFDLFAALGQDGSAQVVARFDADQPIGAFVFNYFELAWTRTSSATMEIDVKAAGSLTVADESLRYAVTGRVSSDGSAALQLDVADWVHPFGYDRLVINRLGVSIALSPEGVTIGLAGEFRFTTKDAKDFLFAAAGSVTNFEAPSALAFLLRSDSPGQLLKVSEVIEGITTIDVTSLDTPAGFTPLAVQVRILDLFLQIRELCFWVVLADRVEIGGKRYTKGFGFRGDITLFGKPVLLYAEVHQQERRFAGRAELPEEVEIGNVLALRRPSGATTLPSATATATAQGLEPGKGPVLAVSSYIDAEHPEYLYVAAEVALFDLITLDLYGRANDDGLTFSFDLRAGTSGTAAWAQQHVDVLVSRERAHVRAGLSCGYGLKDVTLGGFDLFGIVTVPSVTLPDFRLAAALTVDAGLDPAVFALTAALGFTFMGLTVTADARLELDLALVAKELDALGGALLDWVEQHLEDLLAAILDTAEQFASWVEDNLEALGEVAEEVARVLKEVYGKGQEAATDLLTAIGFDRADAQAAVRVAFGIAEQVCPVTRAGSLL